MAKYIEKLMMKQYIKNFCQGLIEDNRRFDPVDDCALLCDVVNFAPAADVVEVTRCKTADIITADGDAGNWKSMFLQTTTALWQSRQWRIVR